MIAWISAARSIVPFAHRSQGRRRELAVDRIHDDANGGHGETAYCGDARHHIVDRECARAYMQRALRPRMRRASSAHRDRPTKLATPSTASQAAGQRTSETDRLRRNPHSV
jgi:hypothetical protein